MTRPPRGPRPTVPWDELAAVCPDVPELLSWLGYDPGSASKWKKTGVPLNVFRAAELRAAAASATPATIHVITSTSAELNTLLTSLVRLYNGRHLINKL